MPYSHEQQVIDLLNDPMTRELLFYKRDNTSSNAPVNPLFNPQTALTGSGSGWESLLAPAYEHKCTLVFHYNAKIMMHTPKQLECWFTWLDAQGFPVYMLIETEFERKLIRVNEQRIPETQISPNSFKQVPFGRFQESDYETLAFDHGIARSKIRAISDDDFKKIELLFYGYRGAWSALIGDIPENKNIILFSDKKNIDIINNKKKCCYPSKLGIRPEIESISDFDKLIDTLLYIDEFECDYLESVLRPYKGLKENITIKSFVYTIYDSHFSSTTVLLRYLNILENLDLLSVLEVRFWVKIAKEYDLSDPAFRDLFDKSKKSFIKWEYIPYLLDHTTNYPSFIYNFFSDLRRDPSFSYSPINLMRFFLIDLNTLKYEQDIYAHYFQFIAPTSYLFWGDGATNLLLALLKILDKYQLKDCIVHIVSTTYPGLDNHVEHFLRRLPKDWNENDIMCQVISIIQKYCSGIILSDMTSCVGNHFAYDLSPITYCNKFLNYDYRPYHFIRFNSDTSFFNSSTPPKMITSLIVCLTRTEKQMRELLSLIQNNKLPHLKEISLIDMDPSRYPSIPDSEEIEKSVQLLLEELPKNIVIYRKSWPSTHKGKTGQCESSFERYSKCFFENSSSSNIQNFSNHTHAKVHQNDILYIANNHSTHIDTNRKFYGDVTFKMDPICKALKPNVTQWIQRRLRCGLVTPNKKSKSRFKLIPKSPVNLQPYTTILPNESLNDSVFKMLLCPYQFLRVMTTTLPKTYRLYSFGPGDRLIHVINQHPAKKAIPTQLFKGDDGYYYVTTDDIEYLTYIIQPDELLSQQRSSTPLSQVLNNLELPQAAIEHLIQFYKQCRSSTNSCGQRCIAFYEACKSIDPNFPIDCLMIDNTHLIIKIFPTNDTSGEGYEFDLGGLESNFNFNNDSKILSTFTSLAPTLTADSAPNHPLPESSLALASSSTDPHIPLTELFHSAGTKPTLILGGTFISIIKPILIYFTLNEFPFFYFTNYKDSPDHQNKIVIDSSGRPMISNMSQLEHFIQQAKMHPEKLHFILINCVLTANQRIKLNTLFDDKNRSIAGIDVPDNIHVITHLDSAIQDVSFMTRHRVIESTSISLPERPLEHPYDLTTPIIEIDLYGFTNWRDELFGRIHYREGSCIWEKSPFVNTLQSHRGPILIRIKNAPIEAHLDIQNMLEIAKIQQKFTHLQYDIPLRSTVYVTIDTIPFDFTGLPEIKHVPECIIADQDLNSDVYLVNSLVFDKLLHQSDVNDNHQYVLKSGLIKSHSHRELKVFITSNLTIEQWYSLFKHAELHDTTLSLATAPGVMIPQGTRTLLEDKSRFFCDSSSRFSTIFTRKCPERFIRDQVASSSDCRRHFFDLTGETYSTVTFTLDYKLNNTDTFTFNKTLSELIKLLQQGHNVMITGISPDLFKTLEPMLFTPQKFCEENAIAPMITGKLDCVLKENSHELNYLACVNSDTHEETTTLVDFPFTYREPDLNTHEIDLNNCDIIAEQILSGRINIIRDALHHARIVALDGPPGAGKTNLVQSLPHTTDDMKVYCELDNIHKWACDKDADTMKILFIDEANMGCFLSFFAPLLYNQHSDTPVEIYFKGKVLTLTPSHRIVLSMNNWIDVGGRHHEPLLDNYPVAIITFTDIHPAVIYEHVLKPIFLESRFSAKVEMDFKEQCARRLDLYFSDRKNESIRQLQQWALDYCTSKMGAFYDTTSGIFLHSSGKYAAKAVDANRIELQSDHNARLMIEQFVKQHFHKRQGNLPANKGGLDLILLTGKSGRGKTFAIDNALADYGYQKADLTCLIKGNADVSSQTQTNRATAFAVDDTAIGDSTGTASTFDSAESGDISSKSHKRLVYKIPASLPAQYIITVLIHAFEEGNAVWIDEIDAITDELEKAFNAVVEGRHPITRAYARCPGFMLFATGNGGALEGRDIISPALMNRAIHVDYESLSEDDIEEILIHKQNHGQLLIPDYIKRCDIVHRLYVNAQQPGQDNYLSFRNFDDRATVIISKLIQEHELISLSGAATQNITDNIMENNTILENRREDAMLHQDVPSPIVNAIPVRPSFSQSTLPKPILKPLILTTTAAILIGVSAELAFTATSHLLAIVLPIILSVIALLIVAITLCPNIKIVPNFLKPYSFFIPAQPQMKTLIKDDIGDFGLGQFSKS